ncbi:MAG: nucleotidyltransferase family protein [Beijerinckiaceae bacterium]|nr:nucleotidyltransferase family protein [Beijerinckiaceae bacterium]
MSEIAAIILAAGQASRFRAAAGEDGPETKLIALHDGKPLVRHVAEAAAAAGLSPIVAVTGHAGAAVARALDGLGLSLVDNPLYATGMASSLKAGLMHVPPSARGVVVLLGDMPLVRAGLIRELCAAFAAEPAADAVAPVHDGQRGNPVLLSARLFPALGRLEGDAGARQVLRGAAHVVEVPVSDAAARIDIDTPEALRSISSEGRHTP